MRQQQGPSRLRLGLGRDLLTANLALSQPTWRAVHLSTKPK